MLGYLCVLARRIVKWFYHKRQFHSNLCTSRTFLNLLPFFTWEIDMNFSFVCHRHWTISHSSVSLIRCDRFQPELNDAVHSWARENVLRSRMIIARIFCIFFQPNKKKSSLTASIFVEHLIFTSRKSNRLYAKCYSGINYFYYPYYLFRGIKLFIYLYVISHAMHKLLEHASLPIND